MQIRFLLLATVAVLSISPAFAQDQAGIATTTSNTSNTVIGGAVAPDITANINSGIVAPGVVQSFDTNTQVGGVFVGRDGTVRPAIGTPAYTQGGYNTRGETSNGLVMPVNEDGNVKTMKDMTPEERRALWDQMPEEQKQKIMARRAEIAKERTQQDKWKNLSGKKATTGNGVEPSITGGMKADGTFAATPGAQGGPAVGKRSYDNSATTGTAVTPRKLPQAGAAGVNGNVQGKWNNDSSLTAQQKASIQRGANLWGNMTPEQKKAFVSQHQDQINAVRGAQ